MSYFSAEMLSCLSVDFQISVRVPLRWMRGFVICMRSKVRMTTAGAASWTSVSTTTSMSSPYRAAVHATARLSGRRRSDVPASVHAVRPAGEWACQ